jgi:hypothetical protein
MAQDQDDDLPLIRELPRRSDPGNAGRARIAKLSQTAGFLWTGFWWLFAPSGGNARWIVGAAGLALIAGTRVWLGTKGAKALDVSHLRLELATPSVRVGGRAQVTLSVLAPDDVRGQIDITVTCVETYAYRSNSDNSGPRRRYRRGTLWKWPTVVEPRPSQTIAVDLPAHLPFTWDGELVSYAWTVAATERVERGLDPTVELSLRVMP